MAEHTSTFGSSAYGGGGWSERIRAHREEIGDLWTDCGIDNEWSRLRAVLLHRPGDELAASADDPDAVQMLEPVDTAKARDEHDAMAEAFRSGNLGVMDYYRMKNIQADTSMREGIAETQDSPENESDRGDA